MTRFHSSDIAETFSRMNTNYEWEEGYVTKSGQVLITNRITLDGRINGTPTQSTGQ